MEHGNLFTELMRVITNGITACRKSSDPKDLEAPPIRYFAGIEGLFEDEVMPRQEYEMGEIEAMREREG